MRLAIVAAAMVLLAGCGERAPVAANEAAAPAPVAASAEPAAAGIEDDPLIDSAGLPRGLLNGWSTDGECVRVLTYSDGVARRAWVLGNDYGVQLHVTNIAGFDTWPRLEEQALTLVADGDPSRSVAARGERGDDDSESVLTILADAPQRALLDGARRVTVTRGGRPVAELPLDGLGKLAPFAERCGAPDEGDFPRE